MFRVVGETSPGAVAGACLLASLVVSVVKVSVVVPTHNRSSMLARTIESLAEQDFAPIEIVVVDNASTDDTESIVRDLARNVRRLRHVLEPRLGVSYARNRGAAEANGELVAFIDDDAVASRGWLKALARAVHDEPNAVAVGGPIAVRWPTVSPSWVRGLEGWYGHYDLGSERGAIDYPRYPFGSNVALHREAFLSVGGFPIELGPRGSSRFSNEEDGLFRLVANRGWTVIYEPAALVYHWVHRDRLERNYLLKRAFFHGQSDVVVDTLAAPWRTRPERAVRALRSAVDAAAAGVSVSKPAPMHSLVQASVSLGRATRNAVLAVNGRTPSPNNAMTRGTPVVGLTVAQLEQFDRDGFVHLRGAFDGADAMQDRMWTFFERRGVDRRDPSTWPVGEARHLQKLLRDPIFIPIGGHRTSAAIDDVLGHSRWTRPNHWGEFLVTFPEPTRPWTMPTRWHTDANYHDALQPPRGAMVFSFINRVPPRHGGTLVAAGSHRLVARFAATHPELAAARSAVIRRQFYASHPWLAALIADNHSEDQAEEFRREADLDGLPARIAELTGDPGDIVIAHPLLAHCIAPNTGTQPRFMRIARPSVATR